MYVDPFAFKLVVNETMNNCFIHRAFDDLYDGTVKLKDDWSLAFTHARKTTGDHPKTIAVLENGGPVSGYDAGDLWKKCTKIGLISDMKCCVYNCPNSKCNAHVAPENAQNAGATAHVYGRFQTSNDEIKYMILLLTCSNCNNWLCTRKHHTNFPLEGEEPANTLYTMPGAQLMFIEVSEATVRGKGDAGKGTGRGSDNFHNQKGEEEGSGMEVDEEGDKPEVPPPKVPPPGVNVFSIDKR